MKFTIEGFSQKAATDLKLDITDLVILRWFIDFKDSGKMTHEIYMNDKYYWIKYESLLEDLPIISLQKRSLARRLKVLSDKQVLKQYIRKDKQGTFSFYATGNSYSNLICDGWILKSNGGGSKNPTGVDSKVHTKDSSIKINQSIKKTTTKESVVVDSSILNLQSKIKDKTNLLIHEKSIIKLLESKTEDKIMYYADNWNKIISTSKGEVGGGLFIDAVMKEYSLPQKSATKHYEIENMSNFEQREYSTEDYEQYYYKVTE